jgi:pimeloyl-ACP methyl ester carboxylesterase
MEMRKASNVVALMALTWFAILLAQCPPALAQTQSDGFQFLGKSGPHSVGLKVVHQYDRSRAFGSTTGGNGDSSIGTAGPRPIQTLIWYPASASDGKPITVGNYAQLSRSEIHFDRPDKSNAWLEKLAAYADVALLAKIDAPMAKGRFPLVVYAPGQSSVAWDNADICEYLASHGYVVVASPSLGKSTRDADDNLDDIEAEATDISFLITYASTLVDVDSSKVAVAGWSWGGISNLFAASRDNRIKALIALDGSMRYYPGLIKQSGEIHPERMAIPLMFFTRGNLSLEDWSRYSTSQNEGPSVLNAWTRGDLWTIHMLGMSHPQFSSMYQRASSQQKFDDNRMDDYDRHDVNVSYAWVARYTLGFLNAYLKSDAAERSFLSGTPVEHGAPQHFMTVDFRAAQSKH